MTASFVSLCCFLLVFTSGVAAYALLFGSRQTIKGRFAHLVQEARPGQAPNAARGLTSEVMQWVVERLPKPNPDSPRTVKLMQMLLQAGYLKSDAIYRVHSVTIGLTIAGAIAGYGIAVFSHREINHLLFSLMGAGIGFLLPTYYLKHKARLRQKAIANQLSDALDLLVVSVEAGLGVSEAIKVVGEEAERQNREIGREFSLVSSDMSAGATMGEALRKLAERTAVDEMRPLASTLIQSEQLGMQIGPALKASADALRDRRKLHAEEEAQRMTIKMIFPLALLVLPAMMMVCVGPAFIQVFRAFAVLPHAQ